MVFFISVLFCALAYINFYYAQRIEAQMQYEEMKPVEALKVRDVQEVLPEAGSEGAAMEEIRQAEDSLIPRRENMVDFETLGGINEDIYAWIQIPGTMVDYPVLQHPSDDAYYLNHTAEHTEGLPGSIYSESVHPKDFSAVNTVLYGHNMKNGTMFGSLHEYEEQEFFDENPYIYIFCPNRTFVYEIFAASKFSDAYLPDYCDYEQEDGFASYIGAIKEGAYCWNDEVEVPFGSRLLTLSTCVAGEGESRFLVTAVLVDEYEKEP